MIGLEISVLNKLESKLPDNATVEYTEGANLISIFATRNNYVGETERSQEYDMSYKFNRFIVRYALPGELHSEYKEFDNIDEAVSFLISRSPLINSNVENRILFTEVLNELRGTLVNNQVADTEVEISREINGEFDFFSVACSKDEIEQIKTSIRNDNRFIEIKGEFYNADYITSIFINN